MAVFLRFAVLSGCGWLLDFAVLMGLVGLAGAPPLAANLVSSALAASMVFLVSRSHIFKEVQGSLPVRWGLYLGYTAGAILVWSAALQGLSPIVAHGAAGLGLRLDPSLPVAAAKVIITPPQLLLNFVMARWLNQRPSMGVQAGGA